VAVGQVTWILSLYVMLLSEKNDNARWKINPYIMKTILL
jgi:hypothetical protein